MKITELGLARRLLLGRAMKQPALMGSLALLGLVACIDEAPLVVDPGYYQGHARIQVGASASDQLVTAALLEVGGVPADLVLRLYDRPLERPGSPAAEVYLLAGATSATLAPGPRGSVRYGALDAPLQVTGAVVRPVGDGVEVIIAADPGSGGGVRIDVLAQRHD